MKKSLIFFMFLLSSLIIFNLLLSLSLILIKLLFSNHTLCSADFVTRYIVFSTGCHHDWWTSSSKELMMLSIGILLTFVISILITECVPILEWIMILIMLRRPASLFSLTSSHSLRIVLLLLYSICQWTKRILVWRSRRVRWWIQRHIASMTCMTCCYPRLSWSPERCTRTLDGLHLKHLWPRSRIRPLWVPLLL